MASHLFELLVTCRAAKINVFIGLHSELGARGLLCNCDNIFHSNLNLNLSAYVPTQINGRRLRDLNRSFPNKTGPSYQYQGRST